MRYVSFLILFTTLNGGLIAQFHQIEQGPGYASAVYLDLADRSTTEVPHTAWDIAFTVSGRGTGILINEGVLSSQATPAAGVELYLSTAQNFETADTNERGNRLYNEETSWEAGAFNAAATPGEPLDLGWGSYDPATQTVVGSRTFLIKTRDGWYHKVLVESLAANVYTFIHSSVEGSSPDTVLVDKAEFGGKTLAYFSFADGLLDLEPADWDLLFTRYVTPLPDGQGDTLDYTVTGVLQNQGVSVARLAGVDPLNVEAPTNAGAYSDTLDVIGYDWKDFDLDNFAWTIPEDLVYFVQTPNSTYRLRFVDFEGGSTGVSTFSVAGEVGTTGLAPLPGQVSASQLFPNPTTTHATLTVKSRLATPGAWLEVTDLAGRSLHRTRVPALSVGLNQLTVPTHRLPAGHYLVRLESPLGTLVHHLVKQ